MAVADASVLLITGGGLMQFKPRFVSWFGLAAVAMAAGLVAGCGGGGNDGTNPGGNSVVVVIVPGASQLGDQAYVPKSLTVHLDETVVWKNNDDASHTVTSDPPNNELNSGSITPNGGTFSHTFTTVGTFKYHCATTGHTMTGEVVVVQ